MAKNEKLPKAFKRKWVKALLSGNYTQTQRTLFRGFPEDELPIGHCCLGVAGNICGIPNTSLAGLDYLNQVKKTDQLAIPKILIDIDTDDISVNLADLNDNEVPFEVIAGVIDTWL